MNGSIPAAQSGKIDGTPSEADVKMVKVWLPLHSQHRADAVLLLFGLQVSQNYLHVAKTHTSIS